jgi:glucose 1-dehydrogenase/3-oxoacyl-[acyl-carrier protein] reductase
VRSRAGSRARGPPVAVADLRIDSAAEAVATIERSGGRAIAFELDVRDPAQASATRDAMLEAFGSIAYLVNNAGLVRMSSLDDLEEAEWDLVLDTNLKGMYVMTRAIAPAIGDAGGGAIVNMSTIESEVVVSSAGHPQVHDNASKGGVRMLTKALAVELARTGGSG